VRGVLQTIPSIALLAFMLPVFGIGVVPAIAALFLYGLLPILRNIVAGLRGVAAGLLEVGRGLGMRPRDLLWRVELPLAAPVILAGIRTAAVISVGTATLAAFIGAGGLGDPIVTGLTVTDTNLVLSGALPAARWRSVDAGLGGVEPPRRADAPAGGRGLGCRLDARWPREILVDDLAGAVELVAVVCWARPIGIWKAPLSRMLPPP
jgi:osmoprotectant transport system permease protein